MKELTIRDWRLKSDLTQEEVAKETGVTKDYISLLERGLRNPSDKMKEKLAMLYSTTVVQIFLAIQRTKCSKNKRNMN